MEWPSSELQYWAAFFSINDDIENGEDESELASVENNIAAFKGVMN